MMLKKEVGTMRKKEFEQDLTPENLNTKLRQYQNVLGYEFGVKELLMLQDIHAKTLIAEAINDLPEFLAEEITFLQNECDTKTIDRALDDIADIYNRAMGG